MINDFSQINFAALNANVASLFPFKAELLKFQSCRYTMRRRKPDVSFSALQRQTLEEFGLRAYLYKEMCC